MVKPKLSIVYYLNSLPLSWGFIHGDERQLFDLDFSPPSRCADLLAQGEVDIGLIPVIEYQRIAALKIVPGLSVASKRPVKSVLLFSKVPIEEIQSVAADSSSRTSVCLLEILLRARFNSAAIIHIERPDLASMLQRNDAALLIGDIALKAEADKLFCYDLAEEWQNFTGKPFVFAFWGVRKSLALPDPAVFMRSFQYGMAHVDDIVAEQTRQLGLGADLIRDYITNAIDYSLDRENLEGLQLFYRLAREYRMINTLRDLEFVN
jgi:chorismate dehydratase